MPHTDNLEIDEHGLPRCQRLGYEGNPALEGQFRCEHRANFVTERGEFICNFHQGQNGRRNQPLAVWRITPG